MDWVGDWVFGGREGCFAAFYGPTPQDALREEHRRVKGIVRRIERDMQRAGSQLQQGREVIQKHAAAERWEHARRAAVDLHRNRSAFHRLGAQKDNAQRVADKLHEQCNAVTIDESLITLTRVMSARLQVMHPQRFAALMQRYETLKAKEDMNEEQMRDFFSAGDADAEEDEEADKAGEEQRVAAIYAELGIVNAEKTLEKPDSQGMERFPVAKKPARLEEHVEETLERRLEALRNAPKVK